MLEFIHTDQNNITHLEVAVFASNDWEKLQYLSISILKIMQIAILLETRDGKFFRGCLCPIFANYVLVLLTYSADNNTDAAGLSHLVKAKFFKLKQFHIGMRFMIEVEIIKGKTLG